MKKFALILALAVFLQIPFALPMMAVDAVTMPTEIDAPTNLAVYDVSGGGDTELLLTCDKSEEFANLFYDIEEDISISQNVFVYLQVDWSLDAEDDWKYHENWDVLEEHDSSMIGSAFPGHENIWEFVNLGVNKYNRTDRNLLFGLHSNDDAYAYTEKFDPRAISLIGNDDFTFYIVDWSKHYVNLRARYVLKYYPRGAVYKEETTADGRIASWSEPPIYVISPWSEVVTYTEEASADPLACELITPVESPFIAYAILTKDAKTQKPMLRYYVMLPKTETLVNALRLKNSLPQYSYVVQNYMKNYMSISLSIQYGDNSWKTIATDNILDELVTGHWTSSYQLKSSYMYEIPLEEIDPALTEDTYMQLGASFSHGIYKHGGGLSMSFSARSKVYELNKANKPAEEPAAPAFTDVAADAYYAAPVAWAVDKKITNGTSDTTFSPDAACTRAQILTFLWRAAGSPESTAAMTFTDVAEGEYYYKPVLWAIEKGIVDAGTVFEPNAACTRSETVRYMWRYAGAPASETAPAFTDVAAETEEYKAVAWALDAGVTTGTSDTTFSPEATCQRGQIVTFLWRAFAK